MPPPVRQRPRPGLRTSAAGLVAVAAGVLLALPPAAGAQEPPPETTPEPPVTLEEPEPLPVDTTTITIHVPQPKPAPPPRPKVQVKAKVAAPAKEPARREEARPEPAEEVSHAERSYEPDASPVAAAPPERVGRPKPRPAARAKKSVVAARAFAPRRVERGLAERVSESAAFSGADDRVPTAAVLGVTAGDSAPFAADGTAGGPPSFVLVLGALGLLTLTFAGALPLLAAYSPETFVPVLRLRLDVSFVGLCLLASGLTGLLTWAISGA